MIARIALTAIAAAAALQTQQTFRTTTDLVMVDVSVRSGSRAIPNLTVADFVVTDNGVRQRIESVEPSAVPIDVTLVVDVSGNYRRPRGPRVNHERVSADLEREVKDVTRILRPTDRVRLLAIDRYVRQVWPFLPVAELPAVPRVESDGLASVYEGLAAALLQPVEPARRHVIVARTKGIDTISAIDSEDVGAIAAKSDALFHIVVMEAAIDQERAVRDYQCSIVGLCWPSSRPWVPVRREVLGLVPNAIPNRPPHDVLPEGQPLKAGAEATGGGWHQTGIAEPSLVGTFRDAFEDFRSGYVLRYTPQGVTRGGWHAIAVTVPQSKGYTVRARKGYGIDEAPPAPALAAVPAVPRTLPELINAYERGAWQNVAIGLRETTDPARLLRDFDEGGNPWPATPRREAAFAVELAEAGVFASSSGPRRDALMLLERFTRFVRHPLAPDEFERQWHRAVLALMQGTLRPDVTRAYVTRALDRFPDDAQFVLARAIVSHQQLEMSRGQRAGAIVPDANVRLVEQMYEQAIALPDTAVESRIRLGHLLLRAGRHDAALEQLTQAGVESIQDPALRYLRQLFLGHVLAALGRTDEAVAAYRAAVRGMPQAQAARVSLMNTLLMRGDRAEALAMSETVQGEQSGDLDPWWMYWQGQYRLYPDAIARLRRLIN